MKILQFLVLALALMKYIDAHAVYTRWGKTSCARPSQVLYTGYTVSGYYQQTGHGGNYLCFHKNFQVGAGNVPGSQPNSGWIFGVEYEINAGYANNAPFSFANNSGNNLQDEDAPCAVCVNTKASMQLMIPGRQDCPSSDMHLEYKGYLVSAWWNHVGRTEYICLDETPEARPGGAANTDGGLFYPVQIDCRALPCQAPHPVQGDEATCAVCTM